MLAVLIIAVVAVAQSTIIDFDSKKWTLDLDTAMVPNRAELTCNGNEMVNLSDYSVSSIEKGFVKSSTVQSILLSNNHLYTISSDAFDEVPNLQCLDLSNNYLSIAKLLNFKHDNLKTLIFNGNLNDDLFSTSVETDPTHVNFPNVEFLSLNNLDYDYSTLYYLFPKLNTIYWKDGHLEYLRPEVTDYFGSNLKSIHLEKNNLKNVRLTDLKNVEELYLDENPLENLLLEHHPKLKILSLANCKFRTSWDLRMPTLNTLDLSGNDMNEKLWSDGLYDLLNLENLSLSHNRFRSFPGLNQLSRLRRLSLSYNFIERFDLVATGSRLMTLSLRGNRLTDIYSAAFLNVPMLKELDLSENQLTSLPFDLGNYLGMLQYLDLRSNKFKTVMDLNVYSFKSLAKLLVRDNYFTSINETQLLYFPQRCTVFVS